LFRKENINSFAAIFFLKKNGASKVNELA